MASKIKIEDLTPEQFVKLTMATILAHGMCQAEGSPSTSVGLAAAAVSTTNEIYDRIVKGK